MARGANKNYEAVHFEITGDQECRRNLRILGEKALSAVVKAAHVAAMPIIADARARAPVRFGYLAKSIGVKVRRYRKNQVAVAVIGARTGMGGMATNPITGEPMKVDPAKYLHLVEFGTSPHLVPTTARGHRIIWRGFMHRGTRGAHFLKAAFDANRDQAMTRARRVIEEECAKALK